MREKTLIFNTILLTAVSLLLRSAGMGFQIYLSGQMGAAGLGLIGLITSVYVTAATVALSGMRFSATRLIAEELGAGRRAGASSALRRSAGFALLFGLTAGALLALSAPLVGGRLIGDGRTTLSLYILAAGLPFLSVGAVLSGACTATGRIGRAALGQLTEQAASVAVTVLLFSAGAADTVEHACAAFAAGCTTGEVAAFALLGALALAGRRRKGETPGPPPAGREITGRLLRIAAPLALSAIARTALTTVQNLLVPRGLRRSGAAAERALADYGTIQGMVFPVITFPSAFFYALAELLVPELTKAQVAGDQARIDEIAGRILRMCLLFSVAVMGLLLCYAADLGRVIYGDTAVGRYIRLFAALMPVYYMDAVTDGMLRGLGQHLHSMKYNVIDAAVSVVLTLTLLPRYGVAGYVFVLYFSEVFNFTMSFRRLRQVARVRLPLRELLRGGFSVFAAAQLTEALPRLLGLPEGLTPAGLTLRLATAALLCAALLRLTGPIAAPARQPVRRRDAESAPPE